MRTQTHFYGPVEVVTHYDEADAWRCEVTTDGVTHRHVACLELVGRQWHVFAPGEHLPVTTLGWVRRNAWMRWEALRAHEETFVLVACKSTMAEAISAVLEVHQ